MSILEQWTAAAGAALGLDPDPLSTAETKAVLDVTGDVAHAVARGRPVDRLPAGSGRGPGPDPAGRFGSGPRGGRALVRAHLSRAALPDSYEPVVTTRAGHVVP